MKITKIGTHKVIEYSPIINGKTKYIQTVYEWDKDKRLTVDTLFVNDNKHLQVKTFNYKGKTLKEIVFEYFNNKRSNKIRVT